MEIKFIHLINLQPIIFKGTHLNNQYFENQTQIDKLNSLIWKLFKFNSKGTIYGHPSSQPVCGTSEH